MLDNNTGKKVVLVHGSDVSIPDGATQRVVAFVKALMKAGYDTYLVIPRPRGDIPVELRGAKMYTVPIKARSIHDQIIRGLMVLHVAKAIATKRNAIIQIEHSTLGGLATLIGINNFILDVHDIIYTSPAYLHISKTAQRFVYLMERRAVSTASKIIVISNIMKQFLITQWNVPKEKIVVIPNGCWREKIKRLINKNHGYEEDFIARIGHIFEFFNIEALIQLAKSLKNTAKIVLIGDGILRPYLKYRLRKENIKNVIITGYLPYKKAMKILMKARITFECMKKCLTTMLACPVKILDYAALGKAMVLSDVSEVSYELRKKGGALVSDPEEINAFVDNVHKLLIDDKLKERISQKAMEFVKDYAWEKIGQNLIRLYEERL